MRLTASLFLGIIFLGDSIATAQSVNIDVSDGEEETSLLRLEEIIAKQGDLEFDFSFGLSAASSSGVSSSFQNFDFGNDQIVSIPTVIDQRTVESNTVLFNTALRYGYSETVELSLNASMSASDTRILDSGNLAGKDSSTAFNTLGVGTSYQFSEDDETPALIGFANLTLAEATTADADDYVFGRSANIGLRAYRVVDPIVFTATGGYRFASSRTIDDSKVDPGDVIYFSPGVAFSVNDVTTLTGGLNLSRVLADEINGVRSGTDRTRAEMEFGVGYGLSRNTTVRAAMRADVVGDGGATLLLSFTRKFDRNIYFTGGL